MTRAAMFLAGAPLAELGSVQDALLQCIWMRRESLRIFEANINILANGLSLDPQLSSKIESLMQEYIEMIIPGAREQRKKSDEAFITRTAKSLEQIAQVMAAFGGGRVDKKKMKRDLFGNRPST